MILPIQITKGCYHNKCTFCNFCYTTKYKSKNIQNVFNELKNYRENYNIKHFFVVDDSLHPFILEKLSDIIIENNLEIYFDIFARLEKEFTFNILNKAYKAGLRRIRWGIESTNKRINKLMNKGIDLNNIENILKCSSDIGIYNTVNLIYGFPTATYEEDMESIEFLKKTYKDGIVHYKNISQFSVRKGSDISINPDKYKIEIVEEQNDFDSFLKFKYKVENLTAEKMKISYKNFDAEYESNYYKLYLTSTQSFLYACKYGKDKLNNLKIK